MIRPIAFACLTTAGLTFAASAQTPNCTSCAEWNKPQAPFRIFGNSYYVGTQGLSSILITSDQGHVLIDGGLAESASLIAENIRSLGFKPEDVKLILNSHVHFDHAGGIAALQKITGARVAASGASASVLKTGGVGKDDPQAAVAIPIAKVDTVATFADKDILRVGPIAMTAHLTPGHTPGGTSWSWQSCQGAHCVQLVYADSLTAVSADSYKFSAHPDLLAGFEKSFTTLENMRCDILVTPHPGALLTNAAARDDGKDDVLLNTEACRAHAKTGREGLAARLAREKAQ